MHLAIWPKSPTTDFMSLALQALCRVSLHLSMSKPSMAAANCLVHERTRHLLNSTPDLLKS